MYVINLICYNHAQNIYSILKIILVQEFFKKGGKRYKYRKQINKRTKFILFKSYE